MGRTFIRQDIQIRNSYTYTDSTPPTLAAYETNPTNIETDLNNLRSQVQNFLNRSGASFPVGNWYDDISTPVTLEGGAARGINTMNQDLHDFEHKRVLVENYVLTDISVPAAVAATGTLTGTANFSSGDTVTIGSTTYTFLSPWVDGTPFTVDCSVSLAATLQNLKDAINLTGTIGTQYGTGTTIHPTVTATTVTGTTLDVEAKLSGTGGNTIATTSSVGDPAWGGATLSGGVGDVVVLALGELPTNTTAAIGSVTTLGTVGAYNSGFPNQSLAEVSGTTAISPKNLSLIVDASTRDPILSSGRVIYALFQTESNTDGSTMTGTTPNRAMLSFVRINSTGDDLEYVPASDIAGKTINYSTKTRKYLLGLTEQDFLKGAEIDVPSAATVTRQIAYDNQGTTPVELTTNATLDLNSAGIVWSIRDLTNANLFTITEGSTGGTTTIQIAAATDVFDVNAVVNDFLNGASFDTGAAGTTINVGVTANTIDSGGALTVASGGAGDLKLDGAAQLVFEDQWKAGSTYASDLVLSDTSAEWSQFETDFGEVSILQALHLAYTHGSRKPKVYANVTATTTAGLDVGGVGGGANLDAQLPDMSGGTFLTDYDVYVNGELMRPAAGAGVNDYYPGTSLINGQLKFDFVLRVGDVICVVPYNA